jgi:hypothetical protein
MRTLWFREPDLLTIFLAICDAVTFRLGNVRKEIKRWGAESSLGRRERLH